MGNMVTFASNGSDARGHLALPDGGTGPGLLVIQEWWGLNSQMKGVADFLASKGFVALAPDLYGDSVKAAVPFYGFPQGDGEPDWSGLTAAVRGHMASPDDFFPPAAASALGDKLKGMGKDVEITIHEAGHAFMNEENAFGSYDEGLAGELWPQIIDFLHETLGA